MTREADAQTEAAWRSLLADPPADLEMEHDFGEAHGLGGDGRQRLTLTARGTLTLERWRGPDHERFTARIDPERARALIQRLGQAGFASAGDPAVASGASFRVLRLRLGGDVTAAVFPRVPHDFTEPTAGLFRAFDGLAEAIRDVLPYDGMPPRIAVSDVVRIEP